MIEPISVIVPARNEAETIAAVVRRLRSMDWVDEIVVVDNASTDGTAEAALQAGARSVYEARPGMGHAVRAGLGAARNDWVMKLDADLDKFDTSLFARMPAARAEGVGLVKGAWHDPKDNMPMTRLLVMPALARMFPGLSHLRAPNSGIYLVDRRFIAHQELVGSYAADLDVMLRVFASGAEVREVEIGQISHDPRDLSHYNAMAEVIMGFFLELQEKRITEELVVLAEDAGQVIDNALGVLAARSKSGGPVAVYLARWDGPEAAILRTALAPFPTAKVQPMETAGAFVPQGPTGQVKLFAPYPAAHESRAIAAALQLQGQLVRAPELLLMPLGQDRGAVDAFRPDVALDVGVGAAIKQAALDQLVAVHPSKTARTGPREMFQSFASLPEPLKIGLLPPHPAGVRSV